MASQAWFTWMNDPDLGDVGGTKFSDPSGLRPVPIPVCGMGEAVLSNTQGEKNVHFLPEKWKRTPPSEGALECDSF
jgi:hypothetical protein